jgi:hypothetical protein
MERWRPRGRDLDARDDPGAPPREVGEVVRGLLAESPMRRGVALGRLVRAWDRVVGPQLSREARPVGLDQGALLVAASDGAWAAQIRFLTEEIRRRANEELGAEEIRSVRVVVGLGRQGGAPAD